MSKILINQTSALGFDIRDKILRYYILFSKSSDSSYFVLSQFEQIYLYLSIDRRLFTDRVVDQFSDRTKLFEKFRIEFLLVTAQFELAKKTIKYNEFLSDFETLKYIDMMECL